MIVIHLILALLTGWIAWSMIHPQTFFGFLGFLIVWGVIEQALAYVVGLILVMVSD